MAVKYNLNDEILEFTVREPSGKRIETRRANKEDSEEGGKILNWLIHKWGWHPKVKKDLIDIDKDFLSY